MDSNNIQLTEEQRIVLENCDKNIYISSSPGSGKSTMLSKICEQLLTNPLYSILMVTFTNKAAKSIIGKCSSVDQTRIIGGTFHGIAYKLLRTNKLDNYICDENKKRLIIKKIFDCKGDREKFERICDQISSMKSKFPLVLNPMLTKYQDELAKYKLIDFDDIIYNFISYSSAISFALPIVSHILVDELQDTSGPQLEMLKILKTRTNATMIGVSDDDQCQPGDTRILTTGGYKLLSQLDQDKDKIPAFINKGSYIGGLKNGFSFSKSVRKYTGLLYTVTCGEKEAQCTPNHKWLVKWSNQAKTKHVVYLMRKDDKYRVGWCQIFNSEGTLHLGIRARLEKADALWILEVCDSKRTASIKESIIAAQYGIPTITFEQGKTHYDKEAVEQIYSEIGYTSLIIRVNYLLEDKHLLEEFPIWTAQKAKDKQGGTQRFKIQTCNLTPTLFDIPIQTTGKNFEWKNIDTIRTNFVENLDVYSLDVKVGKDTGPNSKTYICNSGMVTSNSIYQWRGARPENVKDFISTFGCTVYNMGYNFRSAVRIVHHSKNLIELNKDRIPKIIRPFKKENGIVSSYECENAFDEIPYVVSKCKQLLGDKKQIGILYRNRMFKNHLEFELRKAGLKYEVNDFLEVSDRSSIKVMLSVLKICTGEFDIYDLQNAAKAIKGFGNASVTKLESQPDCITAFKEIAKSVKTNKRISHLLELQYVYSQLQGSNLVLLVKEIEKHFNKSFDYAEEMRSFLIDISKDYTISNESIKRLYNELGLNGKEEHKDENSNIELSTVHGYKGCERDVIILPWCQSYLEPKPGKVIKIEEERRLFYVAITRAKSELYMSYSGKLPQFIKEMKI